MITIRLARPDDSDSIAAIYAPIVRDTVISFEIDPPTPEEMRQRINATLVTHPWLVAEQDDAVVGYAYASQHRTRSAYRWSCDVTAYMAEAARGKGTGMRLYAELFDILSAQGFHAAFAGISLPNAASVALHEKAGFEPVGIYSQVGYKHGAWHDVGWWQRRLVSAAGSPDEPRLLKDVLPKRTGD